MTQKVRVQRYWLNGPQKWGWRISVPGHGTYYHWTWDAAMRLANYMVRNSQR